MTALAALRRHPTPDAYAARRAELVRAAIAEGCTLAEIAKVLGVTRARVWQIARNREAPT